ncbi:MAG: putative membrane protein [Thermoanaerobacterales bacterium 50_218]|nr:MAG: putative membrane protein [Thermoanaerobacterales bacterium 50_218]HAA89428.1 hypothetical protein [Peptococcaceae bacterium]
MRTTRGILIKKSKHSSIILTPDGEFKKVATTFGDTPVGQEVSWRPAISRYVRVGSIAAVILICLLGWQLFQGFLPQAAAFVSLEFGPGIEFALDKNGIIIKASPLNEEGQILLTETQFRGRKLEEALELVLEKAKTTQHPLICTYTILNQKNVSPANDLDEKIEKLLSSKQYLTSYTIQPISQKLRAQARKQGITPGKYFFYLVAKKQGKNISLDEIKNENWQTLRKNYQDIANTLFQKPQTHKKPNQLVAPEKEVEENRQQQTQQQTGNQRKVKSKIPSLIKDISRQTPKRSNFTHNEKK